MLKNIAAIATLVAFAQAVQLYSEPKFDHVAENEAVDSCWEKECAARTPEEPDVEEKIEEIEEAVDSVEEEIEEAIEEIVEPKPEPEEESEESEVEEEEEEEESEEDPIIVLPPEEPIPEAFIKTQEKEKEIEIIKEKTQELVDDFCGLPWETPLEPQVAEKALADAIDTVSNYEMAEDDQLEMMGEKE